MMFVLDSHCDTPSQILRLRDLSADNDHAHVDFPKLKKGKVDGAFFALYVPSSLDDRHDAAFEYASSLLNGVVRTVEANPDAAAFAMSSSDALSNKEKGLFSVFLGLENGSPVGYSLDKLKWFYDKGVRYVTLCHSLDNHICDSCASDVKRWGGLSPFGKELVAQMNKMGMLVDVSHASDETFYDVLEHSSKPVAATHSCCRALAGHPRNMSDDMIRALAEAGGVIQINFYPLFLDSGFGDILSSSGLSDRGEVVENEFIKAPSNDRRRAAWYEVLDKLSSLHRPSFRRIADHIDHVVELVGVDHVGLGSDFDGIAVTPDGMEDISMMPVLWDELRLRGYSDSELSKIASGNFFRILDAV